MMKSKKITISILALVLLTLGTISMILYFSNFGNEKVPQSVLSSLPGKGVSQTESIK